MSFDAAKEVREFLAENPNATGSAGIRYAKKQFTKEDELNAFVRELGDLLSRMGKFKADAERNLPD